jgi:hypothetical protein
MEKGLRKEKAVFGPWVGPKVWQVGRFRSLEPGELADRQTMRKKIDPQPITFGRFLISWDDRSNELKQAIA